MIGVRRMVARHPPAPEAASRPSTMRQWFWALPEVADAFFRCWRASGMNRPRGPWGHWRIVLSDNTHHRRQTKGDLRIGPSIDLDQSPISRRTRICQAKFCVEEEDNGRHAA